MALWGQWGGTHHAAERFAAFAGNQPLFTDSRKTLPRPSRTLNT